MSLIKQQNIVSGTAKKAKATKCQSWVQLNLLKEAVLYSWMLTMRVSLGGIPAVCSEDQSWLSHTYYIQTFILAKPGILGYTFICEKYWHSDIMNFFSASKFNKALMLLLLFVEYFSDSHESVIISEFKCCSLLVGDIELSGIVNKNWKDKSISRVRFFETEIVSIRFYCFIREVLGSLYLSYYKFLSSKELWTLKTTFSHAVTHLQLSALCKGIQGHWSTYSTSSMLQDILLIIWLFLLTVAYPSLQRLLMTGTHFPLRFFSPKLWSSLWQKYHFAWEPAEDAGPPACLEACSMQGFLNLRSCLG